MKYLASALLVFLLLGSLPFAIAQKSRPEDVRLPNGRVWGDLIAAADYEDNLRDARKLEEMAAGIRREIEDSGKFVLPLKALRNVEDAEKLLKNLKARLRKN